MSKVDLSSVIIQEVFYSRHAKHRYRLAPQRKGIGSIDLSHIKSNREFYKEWMDYVGKTGNFSLLSRSSNGRLRKCIAMIRVTEGGIKYRDNRCALCVILRNRSNKRIEDMKI